MRYESFSKYCAVALIINLTVAILCLAQGSSQAYSQLLKEAVFKSSRYRGGPKLLTTYRRNSQLPGSPRFIPLVEGLDDSNAVPFLLKVIYEGPDWDPNDRFSQPRYQHIAKCYAVLSLASSGDPSSFSVLTDILQSDPDLVNAGLVGHTLRKHDIRMYAAVGLYILGEPNAVELLVRMLRDDNPKVKHQCLWALAGIGDLRALKSIMEVASDEDIDGLALHTCLQKMTKVKFSFETSIKRRDISIKAFPELDTAKLGTDFYKKVWQHWYKVGKSWTAQQFEKRYQARKKAPKNTKYKPRLDTLGIPALPFMIEKVKLGENAFIPLISRLVDQELPKDATHQQCLEWWEKNKHKWLITFDKPKKKQ